jgi:hypothetical protein
MRSKMLSGAKEDFSFNNRNPFIAFDNPRCNDAVVGLFCDFCQYGFVCKAFPVIQQFITIS